VFVAGSEAVLHSFYTVLAITCSRTQQCSSVGVDADRFRNYLGEGHEVPAEHLLIEPAFRLTLSAPKMTVLLGGLAC
jgi:catalase (peroxidase I)